MNGSPVGDGETDGPALETGEEEEGREQCPLPLFLFADNRCAGERQSQRVKDARQLPAATQLVVFCRRPG